MSEASFWGSEVAPTVKISNVSVGANCVRPSLRKETSFSNGASRTSHPTNNVSKHRGVVLPFQKTKGRKIALLKNYLFSLIFLKKLLKTALHSVSITPPMISGRDE